MAGPADFRQSRWSVGLASQNLKVNLWTSQNILVKNHFCKKKSFTAIVVPYENRSKLGPLNNKEQHP